MIEKIIQKFKNAKPKEIKKSHPTYVDTHFDGYTLKDKGVKFELVKYIGPKDLSSPVIYDLYMIRKKKIVGEFSSFWRVDCPRFHTKVNREKLEELYNFLDQTK